MEIKDAEFIYERHVMKKDQVKRGIPEAWELACEQFEFDPKSSFCNKCGYRKSDHRKPKESVEEISSQGASQDSIGVPLQPRFTEGGQELAVCKHCGHELIALSEPPYDRNWVHRNPHGNFPVQCQLETEAEPSDFPENVSAEAADAYLRGEGTIRKCDACGQDATLTNEFVTHLMARYAEVVRERDALRNTRATDSSTAAALREALEEIVACDCQRTREQARTALAKHEEGKHEEQDQG